MERGGGVPANLCKKGENLPVKNNEKTDNAMDMAVWYRTPY
jgi:hypothetical protein